jgi:hypothetical protein
MRSSWFVRASDCQCQSRNSPGFDLSILRNSGNWGAADAAVLNTGHRIKKITIPPFCLFGIINPPNGTLLTTPPPPPPSQLRCSATPKIIFFTISRNKMLSVRPELGPPWGVYFYIGLHCTLLSYAAPFWATLHPNELCCTLLTYAAQ